MHVFEVLLLLCVCIVPLLFAVPVFLDSFWCQQASFCCLCVSCVLCLLCLHSMRYDALAELTYLCVFLLLYVCSLRKSLCSTPQAGIAGVKDKPAKLQM